MLAPKRTWEAGGRGMRPESLISGYALAVQVARPEGAASWFSECHSVPESTLMFVYQTFINP